MFLRFKFLGIKSETFSHITSHILLEMKLFCEDFDSFGARDKLKNAPVAQIFVFSDAF